MLTWILYSNLSSLTLSAICNTVKKIRSRASSQEASKQAQASSLATTVIPSLRRIPVPDVHLRFVEPLLFRSSSQSEFRRTVLSLPRILLLDSNLRKSNRVLAYPYNVFLR